MAGIVHAYNEMYLGDIKRAQRSLFGYLARPENHVDMDRFVLEYMNSETRAALDIAWPRVASLNGRELLTYLHEEESYELPQGECQFSVGEAEWAGRFFADYQWYWNISSRELIKRFPVEAVHVRYPGLHTQGLRNIVMDYPPDTLVW